jgi:hypothetical protein
MKRLLFAIVFLINFLLLSTLNASEYWESNFDKNTEGWQVYLGSYIYTKKAPQAVADALAWVIRSVVDDPVVAEDSARLNDILSEKAAYKCGS